jgi:DNA modification methylase
MFCVVNLSSHSKKNLFLKSVKRKRNTSIKVLAKVIIGIFKSQITRKVMLELDNIYNMDCIEGMKQIPDGTIDCVVTSPPYYALRDYNVEGQIGLEASLDEYIDKLVAVFDEVRRILKQTGTLWLNIGDCYATGTTAGRQESPNPGVGANNKDAQNSVPRLGNPDGCKTKDLVGVPWMLAFALRCSGWYLRQDIIWQKPNAMPESVKDRCVKSHEYIFLLSKSGRYFIDYDALREPSVTCERPNKMNKRNVQVDVPEHQKQFCGGNPNDGKRTKRDVWSICVEPGYKGHHAVFPISIPRQCIMIGCPKDGIVFDPFMGSGTTAIACVKERRHFIGFELSKEYFDKAMKRIKREQQQLSLF